jgi:hypothetical protein
VNIRLYQRESASPIVWAATHDALRAVSPARPPFAVGAAASVRGKVASAIGGIAASQAVDPTASVLRNRRTIPAEQPWKS